MLRKISLIDVSFAFLSNDDFVKDETLITSSLKAGEVKKVKKVKAAETAKV